MKGSWLLQRSCPWITEAKAYWFLFTVFLFYLLSFFLMDTYLRNLIQHFWLSELCVSRGDTHSIRWKWQRHTAVVKIPRVLSRMSRLLTNSAIIISHKKVGTTLWLKQRMHQNYAPCDFTPQSPDSILWQKLCAEFQTVSYCIDTSTWFLLHEMRESP